MIRVRTGSRLHFGFFHVPGAEPVAHWPNREGNLLLPARHFGGVGLMIDEPAVQVCFSPGDEWSAAGPLASRALAFARLVESKCPGVTPGRLVVEHCPLEHYGLGTGTQLGLAVARAVTPHRPDLSGLDLAHLAERGKRSALGVHGFGLGGFLVEGGKRTPGDIAPLLAHQDFPEEWHIMLVLPDWGPGLTGTAERQALAQLPNQSLAETDALCRLALLGMLPALIERDLPAFGEAVYDFNRRVGAVFRAVQGGIYAHARSEAVVDWLRRQGVAGVGQSSWGPGLFAVVDDSGRAADLAKRLSQEFALPQTRIIVTHAKSLL